MHAITCSKVGNEFVIHVPEEYDYRYSHPDKYRILNNTNFFNRRDIIISYLSILFEQIHPGSQFHIHYRDEINLEPYTTRERDKEKGIQKMPKDFEENQDKASDLSYVNVEDNKVKILCVKSELIQEETTERKRTITLFSHIKGTKI